MHGLNAFKKQFPHKDAFAEFCELNGYVPVFNEDWELISVQNQFDKAYHSDSYLLDYANAFGFKVATND